MARALMNTREVAEYLRIKERKVYALVQQRRIPCSRVTGKWLFPKVLIDLWIARNVEGASNLEAAVQRLPVIAGSHDPLLEWAAREAGTALGVMFDGSLDGLRRYLDGKALLCGLHVLARDTLDYNVAIVSPALAGLDSVLIHWAWREQGLIVAPGNPHRLDGPGALLTGGITFIGRQDGAGSHLLLEHLFAQQGLDVAGVKCMDTPARNETDVAMAIFQGRADAGLGIAAVARQFQLDFVPLHRERYDLLVGRRDYFDSPFQKLLEFSRGARFADKAAEFSGYDVSDLGRVLLNGS